MLIVWVWGDEKSFSGSYFFCCRKREKDRYKQREAKSKLYIACFAALNIKSLIKSIYIMWKFLLLKDAHLNVKIVVL